MPSEFENNAAEEAASSTGDEFADLASELLAESGEETEQVTETGEEEESETTTEESTEETEEDASTEDESASNEDSSEDDNEDNKPQERTKKGKHKDKSNQAFAEMRVQNKQLEKALSKAASLAGMSVEEYLADIEQKETEKAAAEQNIPVEVFQRLQALENDRLAREAEVQGMRFRERTRELVDEFDLGQDDLRSFIDDCFENGIRPDTADVDLSVLYRGMNFETLLEKERQKWISKSEKNRSSASTPASTNGKKEVEAGEITTIEDLDTLMSKM